MYIVAYLCAEEAEQQVSPSPEKAGTEAKKGPRGTPQKAHKKDALRILDCLSVGGDIDFPGAHWYLQIRRLI